MSNPVARLCLQPAALRLVGGQVYARTGRLPDKQRAKVAKFCESFWKVRLYARAVKIRRCAGPKPSPKHSHKP